MNEVMQVENWEEGKAEHSKRCERSRRCQRSERSNQDNEPVSKVTYNRRFSGEEWEEMLDWWEQKRAGKKGSCYTLEMFREFLGQRKGKGGVPTKATIERNFTITRKKRKVEKAHATITFPKCGHTQNLRLVEYIERELKKRRGESCYSCQSTETQLQDQHHRDRAVYQRLAAMSVYTNAAWQDGTTSFVLRDYLDNFTFPFSVRNCERFFVESRRMIMVRRYACTVPPPTSSATASLRGGYHPTEEQFPYLRGQLIGNPGDGTIGLITWDNGKGFCDFAIVDSLGLACEDIVALGKEATEEITKMKKEKRSGAAGGYRVPSWSRQYDSKSLSNATTKAREYVKTGDGTYLRVPYVCEKTGRICIFNSNYNDVRMLRRDKHGKRKSLMETGATSLRRKEIKEMESRVRSLAIVQKFGLYHDEGKKGPGPPEKSLEEAITRLNEKTRREWSDVDASLSAWEILMLEYACGTGEMINWEALAAHCDGNKSHYVETMWLGGKVNQEHKQPATEIVKYLPGGKLAMVWQGFALDIRCGLDVVHLQLKYTMHAPDRTRDRVNFSRVQFY